MDLVLTDACIAYELQKCVILHDEVIKQFAVSFR